MTTVTVNASKKYDILIGSGLLSCLGSKIADLGRVHKVCIVSENTVFPLWGSKATDSIQNAGLTVTSFVFNAGEENKNASTYLQLLNHLAENKLTRSDLIVALGGGVVGDLAGFAAATYLRGIRYVQVPTTLLAAVDSSVGGKTAIDLPAGKNLAGAFCQPNLVICDTELLTTLPQSVFTDGCAEVIKYGILYDPEFFGYLESAGPGFDLETVIKRCVELKRDAVVSDEFDTGDRMKLNLGHTIGHGVEARSHFCISHGKAVAIGIAIVARASNCPDLDRILKVLNLFGLPTSTNYSAEELYTYILSDKKRSADQIFLIIPKAIGNCEIIPTPVEHLQSFIQAGL